jgi:hypothetical protein
MKCKKPNCSAKAAPGQAYCSRACAPYGALGGSASTRSARVMAESGSGGSGARSASSSRSESETSSGKPLDVERTRNFGKGRIDFEQLEQRPTETIRTPPSGIGIDEMPSEPVKRSTSAESGAGLFMESKDLSTGPDGGKLASIKLIDDSLLHLHGLMKRVAPIEEAGDVLRTMDARRVHAAVGCASSIYKMMRLKLDIAKELKDQSRTAQGSEPNQGRGET